MSMPGVQSCLVTGASGFIGRFLCRYIKRQGGTVRALMRHVVNGPWDDAWTCRLGTDPIPDAVLVGVDTVFHLAGVVHAMEATDGDEMLYRSVNMEATELLAQSAAYAGVRRFVYFSSVKAAGDPGECCVDETWQKALALETMY